MVEICLGTNDIICCFCALCLFKISDWWFNSEAVPVTTKVALVTKFLWLYLRLCFIK